MTVEPTKPTDTPSPSQLLANNHEWATSITSNNPSFFRDLAANAQRPKYLWIGCSDSRASPELLTGLGLGDVFAQRNIANQVDNADPSVLGVIAFAVQALGVRHIIVCGHTHCGGAHASLPGKDGEMKTLATPWLRHSVGPWLHGLRDVYRLYEEELDEIVDEEKRRDRLAEVNVLEQCRNVERILRAHSDGENVTVHGWMFEMGSGMLVDVLGDAASKPGLPLPLPL
ncbi:hypothetical protein OQA88_7010 [Cercophora sp. LCS_1]